jgi:glycosyltransferase involved in cell wall biosynthesis
VQNSYRGFKVALVVPCYNEALAIGKVISDFNAAPPALQIFVFDNNSTDATAQVARDAGATVITVKLKGKGNVVRRMFADVDADVYVMVDGDATYEAAAISRLIDRLIDERLDMVVGSRKVAALEASEAYRPGHEFGNWMLTTCVKKIFGGEFDDMLSGYRVFSRRYAKSFPALSAGFETETELTVHALELRMPYAEVMTQYGARPEGSESKLSTYRDGIRILWTIGKLYVSERPLQFFGMTAILLALTAIGLSIPIIDEFLAHGIVPRLPTAVLSASMMVCALLSLVSGLILDNITRGRQESKRLAYLAIPALEVAS